MVTLIRCGNCKQRLSGLNRSVLDGQIVDWCPRCGKTELPYPPVNQIQAKKPAVVVPYEVGETFNWNGNTWWIESEWQGVFTCANGFDQRIQVSKSSLEEAERKGGLSGSDVKVLKAALIATADVNHIQAAQTFPLEARVIVDDNGVPKKGIIIGVPGEPENEYTVALDEGGHARDFDVSQISLDTEEQKPDWEGLAKELRDSGRGDLIGSPESSTLGQASFQAHRVGWPALLALVERHAPGWTLNKARQSGYYIVTKSSVQAASDPHFPKEVPYGSPNALEKEFDNANRAIDTPVTEEVLMHQRQKVEEARQRYNSPGSNRNPAVWDREQRFLEDLEHMQKFQKEHGIVPMAARNPQMDFIEKAMTRQEGHAWPWQQIPKSIQRHLENKGVSAQTWAEMTPDQRKPFLADIKVSILVATADVWDQIYQGLKMISPAVLAVGAYELLTAYEVLKKAAERIANPHAVGQTWKAFNPMLGSKGLVKNAFFLAEEGPEDSGMPTDAIPFDQVVAFLKTVTPIVLTHAMTTKDNTVLNGLSRLAVALREAATQTRISREMDPRDYDPKESEHSYLSGGTAEESLFEA